MRASSISPYHHQLPTHSQLLEGANQSQNLQIVLCVASIWRDCGSASSLLPVLSLHHFSKRISPIRIHSPYHLHTYVRNILRLPVPLVSIAGSHGRSPRCQFALGFPLQVAPSICNVMQEAEMNSESNWLHSGPLHDKDTNLRWGEWGRSLYHFGHNAQHRLLLKPLKC